MKFLNKETFICLDCEMTGLDPERDQIIEVAVAKFTFNEVLEEFETLIDPKCPIPDESIAIHHITDEMVFGKPTIDQVLPKLIEMIGRHIVIGHGIKHDIDMLARAAEKHGIPQAIRKNRMMDTLRMARMYGESPINSLEQLRKHFNIPLEGAHRAMSDVVVNMNVFKQLCREYKTVDDVFDMLSRPILMKVMPLGKHKGRLIKELPLDYLLWAARKDFDDDLLFSLRSEIKKRKKGNLFSQATNPFSALDGL